MSREWYYEMDQIDQDCVDRWEELLGIELHNRKKYHKIDSVIDEMILEFDTTEELVNYYPELCELNNKGYSFTNDIAKMSDFFRMPKYDFLDSYNYLTESDYIATVKEIGNKIGLDYSYDEYRKCQGVELGDDVYVAMVCDWLSKKEMI